MMNKKWAALLGAVSLSTLITLSPVTVQAEAGKIETDNKPTPDPTLNTGSRYDRSAQGNTNAGYIAPPSITVNAASWVLMKYDTQKILSSHNMHEKKRPASLEKIMTAYIIARAIKNDQIQWDDKVTISHKAWRAPGSQMYIKAGNKVSVRHLMEGMIIASGNDAAVALAQYYAGGVKPFVQLMNDTAQSLGMNDTHFANASGLPAKKQYTSSYDMAVLTRAFINNFPKIYQIFAQKTFEWSDIKQKNRNKLLFSNADVDGVKTGYTEKAGYNLVASAEKNNSRLISVVMATPSPRVRKEASNQLLNYGFRFFKTVKLIQKNERVDTVSIANAEKQNRQLNIYSQRTVKATIPKGAKPYIQKQINYQEKIQAPIQKNEILGTIDFKLDGQKIGSTNVVAESKVTEAGFFKQIYNWFVNLISSIVGWFTG